MFFRTVILVSILAHFTIDTFWCQKPAEREMEIL